MNIKILDPNYHHHCVVRVKMVRSKDSNKNNNKEEDMSHNLIVVVMVMTVAVVVVMMNVMIWILGMMMIVIVQIPTANESIRERRQTVKDNNKEENQMTIIFLKNMIPMMMIQMI